MSARRLVRMPFGARSLLAVIAVSRCVPYLLAFPVLIVLILLERDLAARVRAFVSVVWAVQAVTLAFAT